MAVIMAIDFEAEVRKLFDLFDAQEFDTLKSMFADDAQGVDEISRAWMRGRTAMTDYFHQLKDMGVADIHSTLDDVVIEQWEDVALVTCMADQRYTIRGETVDITAPISVLFRHIGNEWKIELVHAVPLPDESH